MTVYNNDESVNRLQFKVLDNDACKKFVDDACALLEEIGWKVGDDPTHEGRDTLEKAGCRVDGDLVFIPRAIVERALASVPKEVILYDQLGNEAMRLSTKNPHTYLGNGICSPYMMDIETGERRKGKIADAHDGALVCEALPNIDWVAGMTWHYDVDVEPLTGTYDSCELMKACNKPLCLMSTIDKFEDKYVMDMCAAVSGSWDRFLERPFAYFLADIGEMQRSIPVLKAGAPVFLGGIGFPGGTSPVTLGGSIVQLLAESLANLVMQQTFCPGVPMVMGPLFWIMNFKTAGYAGTAPEMLAVNAAAADVFRYLELPNMYLYAVGDSPVLDAQAAAEYMSSILFSKLSGCNISYGYGYLGAIDTGSLEAIVLADEIAGYLNTALRGIDMEDERTALDLIRETGPKGNYICTEETATMASEYWAPGAFTRDDWEAWQSHGAKDFNQRANEKCREIIAQGVKRPKSPEVVAKLDAIVAQAEKDYNRIHQAQ